MALYTSVSSNGILPTYGPGRRPAALRKLSTRPNSSHLRKTDGNGDGPVGLQPGKPEAVCESDLAKTKRRDGIVDHSACPSRLQSREHDALDEVFLADEVQDRRAE